MNLIDRTIAYFAPSLALSRARSRELLTRAYDAASTKRRISDWRTINSSANKEIGDAQSIVRNRARDLRRNNPWAAKIVHSLSSNIIGTGILASSEDAEFLKLYNEWSDSLECDVRKKFAFNGLQKLIVDAVVESGEVLIVRSYSKDRRFPLTLNVLESDYIDSDKNDEDKNLIQGVQFDNENNIAGYWLFNKHPGDAETESSFFDADSIIHVFRMDRPGQVRGISWLAPAIIPLKKLADYSDAVLERLLISNLFAGFISDTTELGDVADVEEISMEPGSLVRLPPGKTIEFSAPPQPGNSNDYFGFMLRQVCASVSVPYELISGDLRDVNFSSSRISWSDFQRSIDDWRYNLLIPQLLNRVWQWFYDAMVLSGEYRQPELPKVEFTPPRRVMVDPNREAQALVTMVKGGFMTFSEAIREQGYNPDTFLAEYARDLQKLDYLGISLESDYRTQLNAKQTESKPAKDAKDG